MHPVLRKYVDAALTLADPAERAETALILGDFAELTHQPRNVGHEADYYEGKVPADLRALELTDEDWREFRQELRHIIETVDEPPRSQLIMAITGPPPWEAVDTVVPLLRDHRKDYPPGQVGSLLISLHHIVDIFPNPARPARLQEQLKPHIAHVEDVFRKYELPKLLDELAAAEDWRISEHAQEARKRLNTILAKRNEPAQ